MGGGGFMGGPNVVVEERRGLFGPQETIVTNGMGVNNMVMGGGCGLLGREEVIVNNGPFGGTTTVIEQGGMFGGREEVIVQQPGIGFGNGGPLIINERRW